MADNELPPLDDEKGQWDTEAVSRRKVLGALFWGVAGLGGVATLGTAGRFLVGNALEPKAQRWVELGTAADFPTGKVQRHVYSITVADAWRDSERRGVLYAYTDDNEEFVVLDGTCTHLGCSVQWQEDADHFACPCHAGFFTREGEVVSGPPPRPLQRVDAKVENGIVKVLV
ncbi:MAG: ubiquinol-cytochrome c reductase iron-sulfur subunit [Trueperaceae bacterium]|nr:ubiquinol-cytochrome c reductase iron-sulfur subunit [Trueperaceae bacterium]